MKHTIFFAAAAFTALSIAAVVNGQTTDEATVGPRIRIGTYDNRAIAVAYAASKWNPVREKMAEYAEAKKAGDAAKQKELEAWGESKQRLLHFQGFGRVPVGELLKPFEKQIAKLAADQQLAAIAMQCDYVAPNVEIVDVTEELVTLFEPTPRTLEMTRQVKDAKPVSLIELADMPAKL